MFVVTRLEGERRTETIGGVRRVRAAQFATSRAQFTPVAERKCAKFPTGMRRLWFASEQARGAHRAGC
jgi:hypothetical protein